MTKEEVNEFLVKKLAERFEKHRGVDNLIDITFLLNKDLIFKFGKHPTYASIQDKWEKDTLNELL